MLIKISAGGFYRKYQRKNWWKEMRQNNQWPWDGYDTLFENNFDECQAQCPIQNLFQKCHWKNMRFWSLQLDNGPGNWIEMRASSVPWVTYLLRWDGWEALKNWWIKRWLWPQILYVPSLRLDIDIILLVTLGVFTQVHANAPSYLKANISPTFF